MNWIPTNRYRVARKKRQAKIGRQVFIIEVDGLPETDKRHAYRTRGLAQAAAVHREDGAKVVRYVPAEDKQ